MDDWYNNETTLNPFSYRSSRQEVFSKKDVLKKFKKFTGKHLVYRKPLKKTTSQKHSVNSSTQRWGKSASVNLQFYHSEQRGLIPALEPVISESLPFGNFGNSKLRPLNR